MNKEEDNMFKRLIGFNVVVEKENLKETVEKWASMSGVEPNWLEQSDFAVPGILGARLDIGDANIYIMAGENDDVAIAKFVKNKGQGLFLVSFEVDNLEEVMIDATGKGAKFVAEKPMTAPKGIVNFAHPKSMNGVQVELMEFFE
jgi:methylmalonyl-CoA/ethylmalonyl-CoA epimerase